MSDKSAEKAAKAAEKAGTEAVGVYNKLGQFVREYSAAVHGEKFVQLAEQFAAAPKNEHFGYTVKKLR